MASRLSFAEAAEALSVTPAAVSQQIKALEDYLQMPVLRRSGRKVELTPEGARLLPGIRAGLDSLVAGIARNADDARERNHQCQHALVADAEMDDAATASIARQAP